MTSKSVRPNRFELAHRTVVLFVVMRDHMLGQVTFSGELLVAYGALRGVTFFNLALQYYSKPRI